jgi:hypothetical protein
MTLNVRRDNMADQPKSTLTQTPAPSKAPAKANGDPAPKNEGVQVPGIPPAPDMEKKAPPPDREVNEVTKSEQDAGQKALSTVADRLRAEQAAGLKALGTKSAA